MGRKVLRGHEVVIKINKAEPALIRLAISANYSLEKVDGLPAAP